ncbi:MAG: hypothetical protein LC749_12585, partial [Actinobacteria bacterium]|nr:hypothetical protein [Actinomycetota bacterium]
MKPTDDLITRDQALALLRELGRPVTKETFDNYRSIPRTGWSQPVQYKDGEFWWRRTDIEAFARKDFASPETKAAMAAALARVGELRRRRLALREQDK